MVESGREVVFSGFVFRGSGLEMFEKCSFVVLSLAEVVCPWRESG